MPVPMDQETIKAALRDVMREEMQSFYVEREEHYQHHQFIRELKGGIDSCQSIVRKVTITTIIGGVIVVLVLGVVQWIKNAIGS